MFDDAAPRSARERAASLAAVGGGARVLEDLIVSLAAFGAALGAIGTPAFVLSGSGDVVHANGVGRALYDGDPRTTGAALRAAIASSDDRWIVAELRSHGAHGHFLVVRRATPPDPAERAAAAAARWSLTARERDVLTLLATGKCNKTIAAELGCAERTVELHITACLRKAGCEHRAELVARIWSWA